MKKRISAFTLIEILVALVIIGIILSFVAPVVLNRPDQARELKIKNDFSAIQVAVDLYKLDNGSLPPDSKGMKALSEENGISYLNKIPIDPWGTEYILEYVDDLLFIRSAGPDTVFNYNMDSDDLVSDAIQ